MAEESNLLNEKILKAQNVIASSFLGSSSENLEKFGNDTTFTLESLAIAYSKEEVFTNMAEQLSSLGKTIRALRSSYLPIELFQTDGTFTATASSNFAEQESYENTFMRMLGMPSSAEVSFAASQDLIYVTKSGELKTDSYANIETIILNERAKRINDRFVIVNNYVYDAEKKEIPVDKDSNPLDFSNSEDAVFYPKLNEIEDNIFYFCYLLIPPIQDGRISGCIHETDKIVAPLFSNKKARTINAKSLKPALLESIIRIRLDKLSGTDSLSTPSAQDTSLSALATVDFSFGEDVGAAEVNADSFGILESMFIVRLRSAISGLAHKFIGDREKLNIAVARTGKTLTDNAAANAANNGAQAPAKDKPPEEGSLSDKKPAQYDAQLLIEDSMMSLLNDNSEALDLQANTQRNSSVHDAHLMSGLLGVIDIPRKRVLENIKALKINTDKIIGAGSQKDKQSISNVLGIDIGVGSLDIIVFSLALFTMSESGLLNLLSDADFDRLKRTSLGSVAQGIADRTPDGRITAVNELTQLVYSGYYLFAQEVRGV